MAIKSTWFFVPKEQRTARLRLVCFPPAGMGAAFFRSWSSELPETVEICAVQLPGSLPRFDEPPIGSIPELAQAIARELPQTPQLQLALFGHSMGAVLASEVARNLAVRSGLLPRLLIVSGRRPPKFPDTLPPISGLPDGAFVSEINRRYNGIPAEILANPDVLALLLPGLRADLTAIETFRPGPRPPIPIPIAAFGGESRSDDAPLANGGVENGDGGIFSVAFFSRWSLLPE